jgi:hypothetical protein
LGDAVADGVLDAAAGFIGRRVKRFLTERVAPAMAAKQQEIVREQIAIAERHPDLRACMNDHVIFLAGGSRVLPLPSIGPGFTVQQADAMVAQLRDG